MAVEHFDVIVVGAGLSGVGAGYYLQTRCPGKRYAILEGRERIGGTWDLFRYPGIRSDSDMFTLGYSFRPWTEAKAIADGPSILQYVRDTARQFGIDRHIRFNHRVRRASWSSDDARWTLEVETGPQGEKATFSCGFLYLCSGYYSYENGYQPAFPGRDDFEGTFVHPQHWPEDLDYAGKRVVVIGSGATAVTLVPAMTDKAAHVTMLQRSPSYIASLPARDLIADTLRRLLPERLAHRLARGKNVLRAIYTYAMCRTFPNFTAWAIRQKVAKELPAGYEVDTHFKPSYKPWDQRLCLVPDSDLFKAIGAGKASMVTDHIDSFVADGIRLKSGRTLPADIVISATGLQMVPCGGIELAVDGGRVDPGQTISYKGLMLSGVPNLAVCFGYTNMSWTLRADLESKFVCRLINHMDQHGYAVCVPRPDSDALDMQPMVDFTSGYIQRAIEAFPKQGAKAPWQVRQNYVYDLLNLKFSSLDDGALSFSRAGAAPAPELRRTA